MIFCIASISSTIIFVQNVGGVSQEYDASMVSQDEPPDERAGRLLSLQQEIRALQETHKKIFTLAMDGMLAKIKSDGACQ